MLYNSNAIKQKQTVYGQDEVHKMKQEQSVEVCKSVQVETTATYKKKEIKILMEFPQEANWKAEEEFKNRLKEIYLRKINIGSMQSGESALQFASPDKTADLKNNLEDKDYE
ncbi:MAG: hypothetical protein IJ397_06115 [Lachnospiraceae bacterium]|nr:hypothetical protein [Lachnospiraceae bacterium]